MEPDTATQRVGNRYQIFNNNISKLRVLKTNELEFLIKLRVLKTNELEFFVTGDRSWFFDKKLFSLKYPYY